MPRLAPPVGLVRVEPVADPFGQRRQRVPPVGGVRADALDPFVQRQLVPVLRPRLRPRPVLGTLGVGDEAVEVEDERAHGRRGGHGPTLRSAPCPPTDSSASWPTTTPP